MASTDIFSRAGTRPRRARRLCMPAVWALFGLVVLGPTAPRAQDAAEFVVRLNRIEGQMRQLSGQVEQLQFENRQLKDQLRKFQEDVEFRFPGTGRAQRLPARDVPASRQDQSRPARPAQRRL